jgi:membrane protease YdiL (CAAX protease family)
MSNQQKFLPDHLGSFFLLTYFISWLFFVPLALQRLGMLSGIPAWLHLFGAFGPLLSGLIFTALADGQQGLEDLISQITRWKTGWKWWFAAALSPALIFLMTCAVMGLVSGDWRPINRFGFVSEIPNLPWFLGWLVMVVTFGLGEEAGWRGFALPRLQRKFDARSSSLILGLVWALWHLPVFFYGYPASLLGIGIFLVSILSGSAFLTWLYNTTGGSVLAALIWHGTYNAAVAGADGPISAVVTGSVILTVVIAARVYGPDSFSFRPRYTIGGTDE